MKMQTLDSAWAALEGQPDVWEARVRGVLKQIELQVWTEIMEGLMAANACADYLVQSREAVARFPEDEVFPSEVANAESWLEQREKILKGQLEEEEIGLEEMQSTMENGGVYPTAYPWMEPSLVQRGDAVFEILGKEFETSSKNCTVSKSTVRDTSVDGEQITEFDVFGVVATGDIEIGATILSDATVAGVTSSTERCSSCCGKLVGDITNTCCGARYCSTACCQAASTFHPALCGKDFSFLYDAAKSAGSTTSFSLDSLLLLRVLTMSIQENASQPLKTKLLDRLTPAYYMDHLIVFNFHAHIITPILTLQALSIDVFSNPLYDTWVLHTIRCRLQNNKHGQTLDGLVGTAVNPLYSMFNHSCDPNVEWEHKEENSTLRCFARKSVQDGEELFISYIGYDEVQYDERQRRLAPWLGRECGCKKCDRERSEGET